jgi:hypothetical protein
MSQTLLFEIGAVIFIAVVTALFLYGLAEFKDWQDRDDTQTQADRRDAATVTPMSARRGVPLRRPATDASGRASRASIA